MTGHTRSPLTPSARDSLDPGPKRPPSQWLVLLPDPNHHNRTQRQAQKHTHKCFVSKVLLSSPPCSTVPTRKVGNPVTGTKCFPRQVAKGQRNSHEKRAKLVSQNGLHRTVPSITYAIPNTVPKGKPSALH